jgi:hypothetical protein
VRTNEEIANSKAVGLFMALRQYLPNDQERIAWVMASMERAILSALREVAPPQPDAVDPGAEERCGECEGTGRCHCGAEACRACWTCGGTGKAKGP